MGDLHQLTRQRVLRVATAYAVLVCATIGIGVVAGPKPMLTHKRHAISSVVSSRVSVFDARITEMVPEHQVLYLKCRVRRPSNDKSLQLVFGVEARARGNAVVDERYYAHEIDCSEKWCSAVTLFAQHAILYSDYDVSAWVVAPDATGYPGDEALVTEAFLQTVNKRYTWYVLWWLVSIGLVSLACIVRVARRAATNSPVFVWTIMLLSLSLLDAPLFVARVYVPSKAVSVACWLLGTYVAFARSGLLLAHFLTLVVRRSNVVAASTLCTTIAVLGAILATFDRFFDDTAPATGRRHVRTLTRASLGALVAAYVAWFAADTLRVVRTSTLLLHDALLLVLAVGVIATLAIALFVDGFDSTKAGPVGFAFVTTIPVLYILALAHLFEPSQRPNDSEIPVSPSIAMIPSAQFGADDDDDDLTAAVIPTAAATVVGDEAEESPKPAGLLSEGRDIPEPAELDRQEFV